MMRRWACLAAVLVLAGCHKAGSGDGQQQAAAEASPPATTGADGASGSPPPADKDATKSLVVPSPTRLAYAYAFTLSLPGMAVESMMDRHQEACVAAGPTVCQVVAANLERSGRDVAAAQLELRATADWIRRFDDNLKDQAQKAGGDIEKANVATEDLDRSLVDTDAALRAKTALRDRIQTLLARHSGRLNDILDAQKQVAEVQGEIDAAQSELAVMRNRVAMSQLSLTYEAQGMAAPDGVGRPLHVAIDGFLGNFLGVLAGLVTLMSYLLPIGLSVGLVAAGVALFSHWARRSQKSSLDPKS